MIKKSVSPLLAIFAFVAFWLMVIGTAFYFASAPWWTSQDRTLNILAWGGIFDAYSISEFTRRTGVKINISYYTTNEELLVMLKSTKGGGYDLVIPSDYAVKKLLEERLLKKLDKSKLNFLSKINPLFKGYDFDPDNEYSLPYMVEFFGLGYDRRYFKGDLPNPSWQWIFTDPKDFKIIMLNDPVEAVCLTAFYLFGHRDGLISEEQAQEVKELLVKQRSWVEAYTDFRPDYFLITGNCPLVVTAFSSVLRGLDVSDWIDFAIPKEAAFLSIENCALVATSKKDDLVYQFLNFAYSPEVMRYHYEELSSLPATTDILPDIHIHKAVKELLDLDRSEFIKRIMFFSPVLPESMLQDLWVSVKAR